MNKRLLIVIFLAAFSAVWPAYAQDISSLNDVVLEQLKNQQASYYYQSKELKKKILTLQKKLGEPDLSADEVDYLESQMDSLVVSLAEAQDRIDDAGRQIAEYKKPKPNLSKQAQEGAKEPEIEHAEYRISAHDEVQINVYGEPDLTKTVRVAVDGSISYPLLGRIKVDGLTAREFEERLGKLLSDGGFIVNPQVSVFVERFSSVSILGEVRNPGSYELKGKLGIIDAIAQAGGFNIDADINNVKILRTEDNQQKTMLVKLGEIKKGIEGAEIFLKPNDTIFVEKIGKITVLGEVSRPGTFELKDKITVLEAIAMAGGFTNISAVNSIRIINESPGVKKMIQISLDDISEKGLGNTAVALESGDTIYVEKIGKVTVLGEVNNPRSFDLKDKTTVLEAIAMAGGFTRIAAINSTRIIRKLPGSEKTVLRIKITDVVSRGQKEKDLEVLSGDIVYVPESLF